MGPAAMRPTSCTKSSGRELLLKHTAVLGIRYYRGSLGANVYPLPRVRCVRADRSDDQATGRYDDSLIQHRLPACLASALVAGVAAALLATAPVQAADVAKVGTCLLQKCQGALAQCIGDPKCLQNIVCLNKCNFEADETSCQIRCGDLYEDAAVDTFNACAVSDQKCVPKRVDDSLYPVPPPCALDQSFDLNNFQGIWNITAGHNPLFDIFDCQVHNFQVPTIGQLEGQLGWRINKPDGDFIERRTVQRFKQDPSNPAILYNHDNEYLHYEDDWYIIASKPDQYVFVYYIGNNDAWKGYGGAVVYTKADLLPQEYIPELREAAEKVGLDWDQFVVTDNRCGPHPPRRSLNDEVKELEEGFEDNLKSFGRGFTVLEKELVEEVLAEEKVVEEEVREVEKLFLDKGRELISEEEDLASQARSFMERLLSRGTLPVSVK